MEENTMSGKRLFGENIQPACEYCANGRPTRDADKILCPKMGVCSPGRSCRKYKYDPLRRTPSPHPVLQRYESALFDLSANKEG